ncbi:MAG: hypothetical protein H8E62_00005, partial [Planctomycetes bacterium]|nr:hypothetical protein [Planctomycetota bacterium]
VVTQFIQGCGQSAPTKGVSVDGELKTAEASPITETPPKEDTDSIPEASANEEQTTLVHTTPQACYSAMLEATETEDLKTLFSCLATADRNQQVGWVAYHVEREAIFQTEKRDAALTLLKKNGLEKADIMGLMQIYDSPGGKGVAKAVELVGAEVKNQPRFMKEASELLKPKADNSIPDETKATPKPILSDVAINGDRASATLQLPDAEESTPILFKRENGSWVITSEPIEKDSQ